MLERVRLLREEPRLIEQLGGLEVAEAVTEHLLRDLGHGVEQRQRHVHADDRGDVQQVLLSER